MEVSQCYLGSDRHGEDALSSSEHDKCLPQKRIVKFDQKVSVRVYETNSSDAIPIESAGTKMGMIDMLTLIQAHFHTIPDVYRYINISSFTSPAFKMTLGDQIVLGHSREFQLLIEKNIRKVLIVESHENFLQLYVRCIKWILPHAIIVPVSNGQDALNLIENPNSSGENFPFDLVLINHRLRCRDDMKDCKSNDDYLSGSDLLGSIQQMSIGNKDQPLLIGTSSNLKEDSSKIVKSGADFLWGFPPPVMNDTLRNEILTALLNKRAGGESDVVIL